MPRPWRPLASESLLEIPPWLAVHREAWLLPDGRRIDDYYRVDLPAYVVIAAVTPAGGLVAERHFRPGARHVTLALPSGYLDPDEDPLQGAQRELLEETGYRSSDWISLGRFVVDGNRACGTAHLFLARAARKVTDPDDRDLAEIAVEVLPLQAFFEAMRQGDSVELATAAAVALAAQALT